MLPHNAKCQGGKEDHVTVYHNFVSVHHRIMFLFIIGLLTKRCSATNEFQHAPIDGTPAGFGRDVAGHPGVEAVPTGALHVLAAVAPDDAEVAEDDRLVLVPVLFAELLKLDAQHGGQRNGELVVARTIFREFEFARNIFHRGKDFLADGRFKDALLTLRCLGIDGAVEHGGGFAFDLSDQQAAVAGLVRVVLLKISGIPLRAEIQVERPAELEQEAWIDRGVIEQLRVCLLYTSPSPRDS